MAGLHPHGSFSGYQALDSIRGPCTLVSPWLKFSPLPQGDWGYRGLGFIHPSSLKHQTAPGAEACGGVDSSRGVRACSTRTGHLSVCLPVWLPWCRDHPLLFTPPDRLTQKASLARPAPWVGGTGEDEGINFWPADRGAACQSCPGNLVAFLHWPGSSHKSGLSRETWGGELSCLALGPDCLLRVTAAGGANAHPSPGTSPKQLSFPFLKRGICYKMAAKERRRGRRGRGRGVKVTGFVNYSSEADPGKDCWSFSNSPEDNFNSIHTPWTHTGCKALGSGLVGGVEGTTMHERGPPYLLSRTDRQKTERIITNIHWALTRCQVLL